MNPVVETEMQQITLYEFCMWLSWTVLAIGVVISCCIKIYHIIEDYRKKRNMQESIIKQIEQNKEDIKELKDTDKDVLKSIDGITQKIDSLTTRFDDMIEKNDFNEMSKAQDRLMEMYRYFKAKGKWNDMEAATFWNIYKTYVDHKGNSFVKEIIAPEMKQLEVEHVWNK